MSSILRPSSIRPLTSSLSPHRYSEHYHRVLSPDLLYLTYDHSPSSSLLLPPHEKKRSQLEWDPSNPYTKNRPAKRPKGNNPLIPAVRRINPDTLVKLERIELNTFVREASSNKSQLLSAIAGFQAITGETIPGHNDPSGGGGIRVSHTGKGSASFKVRSGQVCGLSCTLSSEPMWSFLETLVDLVLPRLKDWNGVKLPPPSSNRHSISAASGVVGFGLPPSAMGLFPQVEVNLEQYARLHGFNISFVTNAKGLGAQDQARALMSGFRIPFVAA